MSFTDEHNAKVDFFAKAFILEYTKARLKFDKFVNYHEGYAVLLEEVDELWDEIKNNPQDEEKIKKETIQVGAMALAIIADLYKVNKR